MKEMQYGLEGKVVVVTGGSRGIGFVLAGELLRQGAKVAICARKSEGLSAAAEKLGGGDNLLTVPAHVAKESDVDALFTRTLERFGSLDALVNNVGMNMFTPTVSDTDLSLWNKILETNLTGTFLCSRKAAQIMKPGKKGKIVTVSSTAASRATMGLYVYGIAKTGMEMLTRTLAAELGVFNIQVNAVAPGMVRTDFSKPIWSIPQVYDEVCKATPMGRIAEPLEVVHPVLFFCSPGSDFITGQILTVDGGACVL